MRVAIMQPYLFPYLGYFQLLGAVDRFVFYDDVNFIKNGWINRNRLVLSGSVRYFTVPLAGASPFLKIAEVGVQPASLWRRKMLQSIRQSYSRAPQFEPIFDLIDAVLGADVSSIGELAKQSVVAVSRYLRMPIEFVWTSGTYANNSLTGAERVLDICRLERATCYCNLPGGRSLYDPASFAAAGVELRFIEPYLPEYPQGGGSFTAALSILDVLMWNDAQSVTSMLTPRYASTGDSNDGERLH